MDVKTKLREYLLTENKDDFYEILSNMSYDIFQSIQNKEKINFRQIPPLQYTRALQEFIKYGELYRFPPRIIYKWKSLIINNILLLNSLTEINGHTSSFPSDEFLDVFDENDGEFSVWLNKYNQENPDDPYTKYDYYAAADFLDEKYDIDKYLPLFSNGHFVLSDYGLAPLMKLGYTLSDEDNVNKILVLINKILDITHPRSDLAELFIVGGSNTLDKISN